MGIRTQQALEYLSDERNAARNVDNISAFSVAMSAEEYVKLTFTSKRNVEMLNSRSYSEDIAPAREPDTQMQDDSRPATDAGPTGRKRPRLDLTALAGGQNESAVNLCLECL